MIIRIPLLAFIQKPSEAFRHFQKPSKAFKSLQKPSKAFRNLQKPPGRCMTAHPTLWLHPDKRNKNKNNTHKKKTVGSFSLLLNLLAIEMPHKVKAVGMSWNHGRGNAGDRMENLRDRRLDGAKNGKQSPGGSVLINFISYHRFKMVWNFGENETCVLESDQNTSITTWFINLLLRKQWDITK